MIRRDLPLLIMWLLTLGGCMPSLESSEPPERIYWLEAGDARSEVRVNVRVSAVPGLNSDRIWILENDQRLNYYAGAFWTDSLAPLVESVLNRSLNPGGPVENPVPVEVLIERFFAVDGYGDGPPDIELTARLTGRADTIVTCIVEKTATAGSTRLRDIVAAHQVLVDQLARAVGDFADALQNGDRISC